MAVYYCKICLKLWPLVCNSRYLFIRMVKGIVISLNCGLPAFKKCKRLLFICRLQRMMEAVSSTKGEGGIYNLYFPLFRVKVCNGHFKIYCRRRPLTRLSSIWTFPKGRYFKPYLFVQTQRSILTWCFLMGHSRTLFLYFRLFSTVFSTVDR